MIFYLRFASAIAALLAPVLITHQAEAADLGGAPPTLEEQAIPAGAPHGWALNFTTYSWLPWLTGDLAVANRTLDVELNPSDVISALDWSTIPVWMSYTELRNGPLMFFNDIVYSSLEGSGGFQGTGPLDVGVGVEVDYMQLTVEVGAGYQLWSQGSSGSAGYMALDVLAGARYWRQETDVSVQVAGPLGGFDVSRSGSVDWTDPFVGARVRQTLAPGHDLTVRGDIGGFGAGSDFSWQAIASYDWRLRTYDGYTMDAYIGYRALSVDYSQGSGLRTYEYDVLQHGPVLGLTTRF
jgi:hypothetical protein